MNMIKLLSGKNALILVIAALSLSACKKGGLFGKKQSNGPIDGTPGTNPGETEGPSDGNPNTNPGETDGPSDGNPDTNPGENGNPSTPVPWNTPIETGPGQPTEPGWSWLE